MPVLALGERQPHAAVGEALGRRAGDRVGEQDRVGDAVDGEVAAGGERADDPRQHRREQLGAADGDLGAASPRPRLRLGADPPPSAPPPLQRQAHRHLGAAVEAAGDREAAGEGGDQREAEPQAGALDVGLRADPGAAVADDHGQAVAVGLGLDLERPGLASG